MRLEQLLEELDYTCIQGRQDVEISAVVYDSRKEFTAGTLFVCMAGAVYDGHDYAAEAVRKGAAALVVSKPVEAVKDMEVTVILVQDTRRALAFISAAWFGHPARKLKTIGITGTKGKTTTSYLV